jgi:hypothetical protein
MIAEEYSDINNSIGALINNLYREGGWNDREQGLV